MSASLIGRLGSSAFRLFATTVSMSLAGSCFSSESAPRPFHHWIRRRGGTIFGAALSSCRHTFFYRTSDRPNEHPRGLSHADCGEHHTGQVNANEAKARDSGCCAICHLSILLLMEAHVAPEHVASDRWLHVDLYQRADRR